jgi:hypothetical protein
LKKKGKRKEETIDLDECLKIKGLRDNRGEARMLLKRNVLIVLFSPKWHRFLLIPQVRRHCAPAKSRVVVREGRGRSLVS